MFYGFFVNMSLLYVTLIAAATLYLIYWFFTRNFSYWKRRNVKHVPAVPFFGNIKDAALQRKFIGEVWKDVYFKFPNEKLIGVYAMTTPAVLICDPDVIKQIFIKDFDRFVDRGLEFSKKGLGLNLFHADGETWRVLRTRFSPMFTSGKLNNMFHLIDERGDKFLDYIEEELKIQPEQNMQHIARMYTMSSISACAFGLDIDYKDPSMEVLKRLDDLIFINKYHFLEFDYLFPGILKKLNLSVFPTEVTRFFQDLVNTVFKQRKGLPSNRNDFMDLIIEMKQQKVIHGNKHIDEAELAVELTEDVIAAQAFVFYAAGFETTSTTVGFLLYELARNSEIQEKILKEIDALLVKHDGKLTYDALTELPYMFQAIDETLRMYPIVDPLQRCALADYKVPGTDLTIKKGQLVFIPVAALHYDPKYYPNPEVFDPDRFSAENSKNRHSCVYLPFGNGPRHCIGMRFARVQSSVFLVKLLSRFRVERSEKTPKNMGFAANRFILGPEGGTVPLKLVHRFK